MAIIIALVIAPSSTGGTPQIMASWLEPITMSCCRPYLSVKILLPSSLLDHPMTLWPPSCPSLLQALTLLSVTWF